MTWQEYETGLEGRLVDLHNRVHRGRTDSPHEEQYRRPMGGNVRRASRRWKTRSSSKPW